MQTSIFTTLLAPLNPSTVLFTGQKPLFPISPGLWKVDVTLSSLVIDMVATSSMSKRPMLMSLTDRSNSNTRQPPETLSLGSSSSLIGFWMISKLSSGSQFGYMASGIPPMPAPGPPPGHSLLGEPRSGSSLASMLAISEELKTFTSRGIPPSLALTVSPQAFRSLWR